MQLEPRPRLADLSTAIRQVESNMNSDATILVGADLNTTLVQDSDGVVGPYVMKRPVPHTLADVQGIMTFLNEYFSWERTYILQFK